jgi:hypothetical protein
VLGGAPADVRRWITVDLAGFPGAGRRGYLVAVEPVTRSWKATELAQQAREIILVELRRLHHLPPDEALGRSLAAANGVVFQRNRESALTGPDDLPLLGVTAVLFDGQTATIAHLPPGQVILVQDGLVYTVPELASWFGDYHQPAATGSQPEPLGYASWTAPHMAQTELRAGDAIVVCMSETGRAYAESLLESGLQVDDLAWHHGRDPERVLDTFRDVVIAREMPSAAVAVISFPPLPNNAQIQTIGDVRDRARESWRHARAMARQIRPVRRSAALMAPAAPVAAPATVVPEPPTIDLEPIPEEATAPVRRRGDGNERIERGLHRLQRVFEGAPDRKAGWRRPSLTAEYGVPASHGVNVFRGQTHYMGDASWRHNLPRLPIIGAAWIWPVLLMAIAGIVLGAIWVREDLLAPDIDTDAVIAQIDQHIVDARDADNSDEVVAELNEAQKQLDEARASGVPAVELDQRQRVVTSLMDEATNVIRVSDVRRIGTLPEEFDDGAVQGVNTPSGVFFVSGSLYQYRPTAEGETPELVKILSQGEKVGNITVGRLWGVAVDARGLYVTDGDTAFMLPVESRKWTAVPLARINNQPWSPGPIAAFDGSIYLLEASGRQIYRFTVEGATGKTEPRDWLLTGARDNMQYATDFSVASDGNIYVLFEDGTIQQMRQGDIRETIEPPYIDEAGDDSAEALVGKGATGYIYEAIDVENSPDGRILAFDEKGQHAVQLMLPIGFSTGDTAVREPFEGIREVIVEESTGTIYLINADGIWTARYTLPELPAPPSEAGAVPTEEVVEPGASPEPE